MEMQRKGTSMCRLLLSVCVVVVYVPHGLSNCALVLLLLFALDVWKACYLESLGFSWVSPSCQYELQCKVKQVKTANTSRANKKLNGCRFFCSVSCLDVKLEVFYSHSIKLS